MDCILRACSHRQFFYIKKHLTRAVFYQLKNWQGGFVKFILEQNVLEPTLQSVTVSKWFDYATVSVTMSRMRKLALVLALDDNDEDNDEPSRLWVHDINRGRQQYGAFHSCIQELRFDNVPKSHRSSSRYSPCDVCCGIICWSCHITQHVH